VFKEANGQISNIRVMSFLCLFYLFFLATYQTLRDNINFEILVLFAVCAFAPKVVQKFAEPKTGTSEEKE